MRKILRITTLLVSIALIVGACAPAVQPTQPPAPAATEVPAAPAATEAPAQTEAPAATEAPSPTEVPAATEEPVAKPKGTLNVALTSDIAAIVWAAAPERQAAIASMAFFDPLLFPAVGGGVEPSLMEGCDMAEDYMKAICTLRQDVVFHNGEPFNADAVIYSFKTMSTADVPYPFPGEDVVTLKKIDDYTVEFDFVNPQPQFLRNVLGASEAIPPKYVEEVGFQAFLEKPVGTGPFVFKEWVKGSHVTGEANPNYWRKGYPKVEKIVFKMIPESSTRLAALQTGEVDIITRLTAEEAATLEGVDNIEVKSYPVDRVFYVAFNNLSTGIDTPIAKKEVRLAMNHAVDRQAIIDALFAGKSRLATGLIVPGDIGYTDVPPLEYDVEKAKALLADAGFPDGFKIDMACPDKAYSHVNEVCESIVGYLEEVGISVNLEYMESGKFWDLEAKQQLPPLFVDSWSADSDPMRRIQGALGKGESYAAWYDQRIQDYIDKINQTGKLDEINQYYSELTTLLRDDPPFIYLYEPFTFEAINTKVTGFEPTNNEHYWVYQIGLTE